MDQLLLVFDKGSPFWRAINFPFFNNYHIGSLYHKKEIATWRPRDVEESAGKKVQNSHVTYRKVDQVSFQMMTIMLLLQSLEKVFPRIRLIASYFLPPPVDSFDYILPKKPQISGDNGMKNHSAVTTNYLWRSRAVDDAGAID